MTDVCLESQTKNLDSKLKILQGRDPGPPYVMTRGVPPLLGSPGLSPFRGCAHSCGRLQRPSTLILIPLRV